MVRSMCRSLWTRRRSKVGTTSGDIFMWHHVQRLNMMGRTIWGGIFEQISTIIHMYNVWDIPVMDALGVLGGVGGRLIGSVLLWAGSSISTLLMSAAKEYGSVGAKCQQRKLNVKRTVAPAMAVRTFHDGISSPSIS